MAKQRAAYPRGETAPEANVAATPPPVAVQTDAGGPPRITPAVWPGWPADWAAPSWASWSRLEQLTDTAWGCLDLNASVIATMPPYLVGAAPRLTADWLNNPDPLVYSSWAEFAKQLFWDFQLGEAFVLPTAWYASGYPSRFHVVPPWKVTADLGRDGLRRFKIGSRDVTADILSIRYQSRTDDPHGHGPLEVGVGRMVAANALARYATNLAVSGGVPHSILTHPAKLTGDQSADLQAAWVQSRTSNMGLPAVLSGGIEHKVLSFDPEKMALVDLARFNEARIAFLLGVPPPLAALPSGQDSLTYNTAVTIRVQHWQAGLKPKVDPVMQALSFWALPRGTTIELNRDEYVKPDPAERAVMWEIYVRNGIVEREEVREAERFGVAAPSQTLTTGVLQ